MNAGDNIERIFTSITTEVKSGKIKVYESIELFKILNIEGDIITINESGSKSNGTFGYREYSKTTGACLDDKIKPSNKSRRSLNVFD